MAPGGPSRRTIRPSRGLPGTRAVVGGLLVAVAALGTWYVATGADRGPDTRYLVASRALGPGERITPEDLALVSVDLPETLSSGAFTNADDVIDTVTLGPIDPGELIQSGAVASVGPSDLAELSFSVEVDWAVGGNLRPGDLIDLFETDQRAGPGGTERVLSAATILDVSRPDDGLGRNRTITITVGVEHDHLATAVQATRTGTISVVRVTGSAHAGSPDDGGNAGQDEGAGTDSDNGDEDES